MQPRFRSWDDRRRMRASDHEPSGAIIFYYKPFTRLAATQRRARKCNIKNLIILRYGAENAEKGNTNQH
jgi:hypothetical protein